MYINTVIHSAGHIYTQNIQGDRTVNNSSNHLKSRIESSSHVKSLNASQQRSESYADIYLELKDICGGSDNVFITSPEDEELISTNEQLYRENLATLNGKSSNLCAWNRDFSNIVILYARLCGQRLLMCIRIFQYLVSCQAAIVTKLRAVKCLDGGVR